MLKGCISLEKIKNSFPDYIQKAFKVLEPPEDMTVTEWADNNRVLSSNVSAEPGKWRTSRTPYLRGIMDSFIDPEVEVIVFVKCTQVGGTEAILNMIGYLICQDPGPTMVVYPTEKLANFTSENRIEPMILVSDKLNDRYLERISKTIELHFTSMILSLAWANSPTQLASKPTRYIFLDETDKYPKSSKKEADPISLARERTKTFPNKKICMASTPTYTDGPIWQEFQAADRKLKYYMPCPHCGEYIEFKFKNLKFKTDSPEEAFLSAEYICQCCGNVITDGEKVNMLRFGEWREFEKEKSKSKLTTGFHINAMYSPWIRFGDVAKEFISSKLKSNEALQNFINSWLGEPYEHTEIKLDYEKVLDKNQLKNELMEVPEGVLLITGGVDIQKDRIYYTVTAFGEGVTSYNIDHGFCETWDQLTNVMNNIYLDKNGKRYCVNLVAIDSGYNAEDTYTYCYFNSEWAVSVKGSSKPLGDSKFKLTLLDKVNKIYNGIKLYLVDTAKYKDNIAMRLKRPAGIGAFNLYNGCDEEYVKQITSEEKIVRKEGNKIIEEWKTKTSHADNHYLDCEVYAMLAADLLGIRYMKLDKIENQNAGKNDNEDIQYNQGNDNNFLNTSKWSLSNRNWIR